MTDAGARRQTAREHTTNSHGRRFLLKVLLKVLFTVLLSRYAGEARWRRQTPTAVVGIVREGGLAPRLSPELPST
jgi:hypothetical protein